MNGAIEPIPSLAALRYREAVEEEESIDLPEPVLHDLGWTSLVARRRLQDGDVRALLQAVALENCAHSWRKCNPLWGTALLTAWENEHRPTEIIGYYGVLPDGSTEIAGMATIAHSINRHFPHVGFPVLARAFIRPEYRDRGLYARILDHRLSFCHRYWGPALKAVHMGSREPKVWHVIGRRHSGWSPFVHVGNEELVIRGQTEMVRGFLSFTPSFGRALLTAAGERGTPAPDPVLELRQCLIQMLQAEPGGHHYECIGAAYDRVRASTDWFDWHDTGALEQFITLCEAIPLTRSSR